MSELRTKIKTCVENKFFAAKVNAALKNTVDTNKQLFLTEPIPVYQRTIDYLQKWYEYDTRIFTRN